MINDKIKEFISDFANIYSSMNSQHLKAIELLERVMQYLEDVGKPFEHDPKRYYEVMYPMIMKLREGFSETKNITL